MAQGTSQAAATWARALGACALALLAGSLLYAAAIALSNFSRIGV